MLRPRFWTFVNLIFIGFFCLQMSVRTFGKLHAALMQTYVNAMMRDFSCFWTGDIISCALSGRLSLSCDLAHQC